MNKRLRIGGWCMAIGVLLFATNAPAYSIYAGCTFDVHQDIPDGSLPDGRLPNDFHVEGLICTANGVDPVLFKSIDGPFRPPVINLVKLDPLDMTDCWYYFSADWSLLPGQPGIPYCTVIHLGLVFLIEDENTIISLDGWWTLDGMPVGEVGPPYPNNGYVSILGFDIESTPAGVVGRIGNGPVPPVIGPIPPWPPTPIPPIDVMITELDIVSMAPSELPPDWMDELREGGMQEAFPWVPVQKVDGTDIEPTNPLEFPAESFFDVFTEIEPGQVSPATPVTVDPGDILIIRSKRFVTQNNAGIPDPYEGQWEWHIHEAQAAEACCLPDGMCIDVTPVDCVLTHNGMPMGQGSNCSNVICPVAEVSCCLPDGICVDLIPESECDALGGTVLPDGATCTGLTEACCMSDGVCLDADPLCCEIMGGNPQGPDTGCVDMTVACCLSDGDCIETDPLCCDDMGGVYGYEEHCIGDLDGNGIDDACEEIEEEACCMPDGRCEMLLPNECNLHGGEAMGIGSMCVGVMEACCLPDGSCLDMDPLCCTEMFNGTPQGPETGCVDMLVACCLSDGSCVNTDPLCCDDMGGEYGFADLCLGDANSNGINDACEEPPVEEACCLPDGTCQMLLPDVCHAMEGTSLGPDSECVGELWACCLPDGVCIDADPQCCEVMGGMSQGPGTGCVDMTVACCLSDGSCVETDPLCCDDLGGVYGYADHCLGDVNSNGINDACEEDSDGDGVPDDQDVCNNTPPGTAVDEEGRPLGDIDKDCDTDLADYALFQRGFTGPLATP